LCIIICLLHCENYIVERNIFLTGILEINNDLPIDELPLLLGNEILNDEKKIQFFFASSKIHSRHMTVVNKTKNKINKNKLSRSVANGKQLKHQNTLSNSSQFMVKRHVS
jgi:hypothetical protein